MKTPSPSDPALSRPRLCIIGEADPFLARLLRRFAEKYGLQAQLAQTGDDVLALAQRAPAALIILDPELPGRQRGWEAARALLAADAPLLVCTWLSEDEALAMVGRVCSYLQKPDLHYADFAAMLAAAGVAPAAVDQAAAMEQPAPGDSGGDNPFYGGGA